MYQPRTGAPLISATVENGQRAAARFLFVRVGGRVVWGRRSHPRQFANILLTNRLQIAGELGIEPPIVERHFDTDDARLAHIIALNLKRRHLDPVTWGEMFMRYAEARGIRVGIQGRQDEKTDTVSVLATELGVNERTARRRLAAARLPEALREQVRSGERTVRTATQEVHRQERRRSYWQKCNRCTFS